MANDVSHLVPGGWTTFAPATTGITGETVAAARYCQVGNLVFILYNVSGTSNSTSKSFTLPIPAGANGTQTGALIYARDNGTVQTSPGLVGLNSNSTTANLYKTIPGGGWTASGAWVVLALFFYEARG